MSAGLSADRCVFHGPLWRKGCGWSCRPGGGRSGRSSHSSVVAGELAFVQAVRKPGPRLSLCHIPGFGLLGIWQLCSGTGIKKTLPDSDVGGWAYSQRERLSNKLEEICRWAFFFLYISRFLSSGSRNSWVNLKSSEWESTTKIFFCIHICSNSKRKTPW